MSTEKEALLDTLGSLETYAWALWADQDENEKTVFLRDPAGYPEYAYIGKMIEDFEKKEMPALIQTYGEPMQQVIKHIRTHSDSEEVSKFLVAMEKVIRHS